MKFGRLDTDALDGIDWTLPEDHPDTTKLLNGLAKTGKPEIYAGCAKWGRKEWVGQLYPEGTKDKEFLDHYVQHFNAIELNSTFYGTRKVIVEGWAQRARPGFKFCPKFFQRISHYKRLKEAEEITEAFLYIMSMFGENLGMCFLQMPDNFTPKRLDVLENYMKLLPGDVPIAVELRHPEWFTDPQVADELFPMMTHYQKSMVITDTAGRRDCVHQRLTSDSVFIRFNGYDLHPSDYHRIDSWVTRLKEWLDQGLKTAYFFAHQEDEQFTPVTCDYFLKGINEACGLQLMRPQFIT
ncbi:MAG: DUF72 domain-containing protein [Cyclobacteriaceae bacterium]|nr:DUF72 domain-containing protein [Cyclobacteriaceae bacterium]